MKLINHLYEIYGDKIAKFKKNQYIILSELYIITICIFLASMFFIGDNHSTTLILQISGSITGILASLTSTLYVNRYVLIYFYIFILIINISILILY